MSKITLEITEVVNGVSITETPITLVGDTLSAAASTTATGVTFTPTGGIAATNVQAALAELDSEKVSIAGGATAVTFNATGGIAATNVQAAIAELDTEKLSLSGGTMDGDFTLSGTDVSKTIRFDQSENLLKVADGVTLGFGFGNALPDTDLEIFHVSNQSYIRDTGAGTLFIQTDGPGITLGGTTNNNIVSGKFIPGAEATLYHNSNAKITTTANGVDVTGLVEFDSLSGTGSVAITNILDEDNMASNSATALATQQSIKAYVDAQQDTVDTFAEILALGNTTGGTDLSVSTDDKVQFRDTAIYINSSTDGQLDIVADTEIQLAATTVDLNGVLDVSGNIVVGGTVDGRDIASDGTKLDGIEASATADQSNAEIRAAVEAATDSNVFTDADHTKLDGIEASATADQSNAEIRAAVEAATDSNVFTDADHTKLNGIEASATADQSNAEIRAAVEAATDSNVFTDADHTKLNGVAANATANVGDITNVITGNGLIGGGTSGAVTVAVDTAVVATASNTLSLNNKTLNTPDINSPDIDGGTVDGVTIGATTPSTGKFTSLTVLDDNPTLLMNDSDGNEQFKISHQGGNSYISSFGSGSDFGAMTFYRNKTPADAKATFKFSTNGDFIVFQDDGSTNLLKTDADQNRVGINTSSPQEALDVVGTTKATQFKTGSSIIREDTNKTAVNWDYTGKEFSTAGQETNPGGAIFGDSGTKLYVIGTQSDRVQQYSVSSAYDLSSTVAHVAQANVAHGGNPQDLVFSADGSKLWTLDGGSDQLRYYTVGTNWDITTLSSSAVVTRDFSDNVDTNPTGFRFNADGTKIILVGSSKAGASGTDIIYSYDLSSAYDIARHRSI